MKKQSQKTQPLLALLIIASVLLVSGCDGGTISGNPFVNIKITNYNALSKITTTENSVSGVSPLTIQSLKFCFKRLRFKTSGESTNVDPSLDEDNIDFDLGEVDIDPTGTTLGTLQVPMGTFERIEFDLEDHCASNLSVQLDNGQLGAPFSTNARVTIKFEGSLTIDTGSTEINLGIQAITSALNTVTNSGDIKTAAESASGSL